MKEDSRFCHLVFHYPNTKKKNYRGKNKIDYLSSIVHCKCINIIYGK